jgi:hypothetical protein
MGSESHYTSSNMGGIKRGDGAETGDLEAQPTVPIEKMGSSKHKPPREAGPEGINTADPNVVTAQDALTALDPGNTIEQLTVKDATNPSLGLTNIAGKPPEDPYPDTRETRTNEESGAPPHR